MDRLDNEIEFQPNSTHAPINQPQYFKRCRPKTLTIFE
jgi:hypothetical protein